MSATPTAESTYQTGVTISDGAVTGTLDYDADGYMLDLTLAAVASEGSPDVEYSYTLGSGSAVTLQSTQALIPITAADLSSTLTLSADAQGYTGDSIELDISGLTLEAEPLLPLSLSVAGTTGSETQGTIRVSQYSDTWYISGNLYEHDSIHTVDLTLSATSTEGTPDVTYSYTLNSGSPVTLDSNRAIIPISVASNNSIVITATAPGYETVSITYTGNFTLLGPPSTDFTLSGNNSVHVDNDAQSIYVDAGYSNYTIVVSASNPPVGSIVEYTTDGTTWTQSSLRITIQRSVAENMSSFGVRVSCEGYQTTTKTYTFEYRA